jgi:hypothetical protein
MQGFPVIVELHPENVTDGAMRGESLEKAASKFFVIYPESLNIRLLFDLWTFIDSL